MHIFGDGGDNLADVAAYWGQFEYAYSSLMEHVLSGSFAGVG